jgi:hypothetical protein
MSLDKAVDNPMAGQLVRQGNGDMQGHTLLPAVVEQVLGSLGSAGLHNFSGDLMQVWRMVSLATGPECRNVDDIPPEGLLLRNFYAHRLELVDPKTGEMSDVVRCVIIGPDKIPYAFISDGIARDLGAIISVFGLNEYEPPIPVTVQPVKTRRGYKVFRLIPTDR